MVGMLNQSVSIYNPAMPMTAAEILEAARKLPINEQHWLVHTLREDEFTAWQKEVGEPEPGYDEWFRARVEKSLADDSPSIPHEAVMRNAREVIENARR